mgnify:CR=1 FL=1
MRLAIGSDEQTQLTDFIVRTVNQKGYTTNLFGKISGDEEEWSLVAQKVAEEVVCGDSDEGILLCWTGTGVSLAANKVPGVRAALVHDTQTAELAAMHNDAWW